MAPLTSTPTDLTHTARFRQIMGDSYWAMQTSISKLATMPLMRERSLPDLQYCNDPASVAHSDLAQRKGVKDEVNIFLSS